MKPLHSLSFACTLVALAPAFASANEFAADLATLTKDIQQALPAGEDALKSKFIAATEAEFQAAQAAQKAQLAASNKKVADKAAAQKASDEAKAAHEKAKADAQAAATALLAKLTPFLASDKLDTKLVKATLIAHATPAALEAFAQQGKEQAALIQSLLGNDALMKQMLVAGGAKFGKYGEAMRIYTFIQSASPKAKDGFLQTLALATALEHAEPIKQSNPASQTDGPAIVDPVKRYQHYETAFLAGELDPDFKNLNVWELRMAVDCDAPDHILAWGREMMRNFRPDHMVASNPGWKYTKLIKTDVLYGSKDQQFDLPTSQQYQNIIMNGGVCGCRAFVGRFLLCNFGIPTWGVTQKGHAAIGRWTPNGWVTNLGAGFQWSWWDKDESKRSGNDFLLETQARKAGDGYLPVLRAQWISKITGEFAYNDRALRCEAPALQPRHEGRTIVRVHLRCSQGRLLPAHHRPRHGAGEPGPLPHHQRIRHRHRDQAALHAWAVKEHRAGECFAGEREKHPPFHASGRQPRADNRQARLAAIGLRRASSQAFQLVRQLGPRVSQLASKRVSMRRFAVLLDGSALPVA